MDTVTVNKDVYAVLVQQSPALAQVVQQLITAGETPRQIESFLVRKFGQRPIVAYAIAAAEYLYSQIPGEER